jgi:hypothetical protein
MALGCSIHLESLTRCNAQGALLQVRAQDKRVHVNEPNLSPIIQSQTPNAQSEIKIKGGKYLGQ